jgi:hypothetical protein
MVVVGTILVGCCRFYTSTEEVINPKFSTRRERVAPVFKHGEGKGQTGCWVPRQPAFCKESAARKVVIRELEQAGIEIDLTDLRVDTIDVPRSRDCCTAPFAWIVACDKWFLDGYCSELNIGFEFLSEPDYFNLGAPLPYKRYFEAGVFGPPFDYDLIYGAEIARVKLSNLRMTLGVFYDPLVLVPSGAAWGGDDWNAIKDSVENLVEYEIAAQVQDFIAWLRQEGYLEEEGGESQ